MPDRKRRNVKRVRTERNEPPQGPDVLVGLDNTLARQKMPRDLADATATQRLTIHAPKGFDPKRITKSREVEGGWELVLPPGAGVGIPGRKAGRLEVAAVRRGIKASADTEAFRPPWVDYTPHPKISTATRPLLRTLDGTWVEPHYGVFGADDRVVYYPSGYPWTCVGKLFVYNTWPAASPAWSGSAVLIGDRVILTARRAMGREQLDDARELRRSRVRLLGRGSLCDRHA